MTSVSASAAYPTENSRVWFSCDPSQKQFLFRTCFATSGRIVLIWMLRQPICMARLLLTSIKSRQGSLPEKKPRAAQNSPSSTGPSLPTKGTETSAEEILEKELTAPPSAVPGSTSNEAVEKWLKKHQSQFRGKASAFKKHVADVCSVIQASEATKQDLAETAVRYGLQKKHADRMSCHNLSTFIGACQFQAA